MPINRARGNYHPQAKRRRGKWQVELVDLDLFAHLGTQWALLYI
jgi:hypothetical protein